LRELSLDRIIFIPTGNPKYRQPATASGEHRLAMLRLALGGEPRYQIDERELAPQATGYTADTLEALRGELGRDTALYLLMGADQYAKLGSWHRPDEVARLASIVVVARPGSHIAGGNAHSFAFAPMPVSASDIRARAARGESLADLVPAQVANYIERHGLYR
jgi:nicotinate-nucleotide adenylyltransferase